MEIDRKTNLILKHADLYGDDIYYRKMVDNTVFLDAGDIYRSAVYVDDFYGTERVRCADHRSGYGS